MNAWIFTTFVGILKKDTQSLLKLNRNV